MFSDEARVRYRQQQEREGEAQQDHMDRYADKYVVKTVKHSPSVMMWAHKVCTYVETRVQSCVWRLPKYWPQPPLHPASVSSPRTKGTFAGRWGVIILEDASHRIGLLQ